MITAKEMKKRFERANGGVFQGIDIITDKETRVQYIVNSTSQQGGITVLVDKDGKPLLADIDTQAPFD